MRERGRPAHRGYGSWDGPTFGNREVESGGAGVGGGGEGAAHRARRRSRCSPPGWCRCRPWTVTSFSTWLSGRPSPPLSKGHTAVRLYDCTTVRSYLSTTVVGHCITVLPYLARNDTSASGAVSAGCQVPGSRADGEARGSSIMCCNVAGNAAQPRLWRGPLRAAAARRYVATIDAAAGGT